MLSDRKGKNSKRYVPCYVVFDFETTGISPTYDEIIEISGVKVTDGKVVEEFSTLVNPGRAIPMQATLVNGISNRMVESAPTMEQVLPAFLDFLGDHVLVGHNIHSFDMKFLYRDLEKYYGRTIDNDYVDTLWLARMLLPELKHHKLTDLAAYYGFSVDGAHRALNDCRMNQRVYEKLGEALNEARISGKAGLKPCPRCGGFLQRRKGRYGEFYGCSSYPACRYTENIGF